MPNWNIAETVFQLGEGATRHWPALIHGDLTLSFAELRQRSSGLASFLQSLELPRGSHVGHYMRNSTAYMETFIGSGLAGMAHVNVNYRYRDDELFDLCEGLDLRVLVYDAEFADRVSAIRGRLSKPVVFIEVGGNKRDDVVQLEDLYGHAPADFSTDTSADDLILIATGGTTGLPKGVQWRNEDMCGKLRIGSRYHLEAICPDLPASVEDNVKNIASLPQSAPFLSLSPLMHGAGLLMALLMLGQGTAVVTLPGVKFSADEALDCIKRDAVASMVLVGDAFGTPLVEALDRRPDEGLLDSLRMLVSSGASLSEDVRQGLLRHQPQLILVDTLGSSEASGFALSTPEAGVFLPMETTRVLDDNLQPIEPGSEAIGIAYSGGYQPIGYYNAPEATAETFVTLDGKRYVKTGDRCQLREDGMLVLLGRDSTVVNTGGEKVYTVEVERVLLDYPAITDALVVGLPHPRFGKQVVAVVEGPGLTADNVDLESIRQHAAEKLADYKVPRQIYVIDSLQRAANGKPDYAFVTDYAQRALQEASLSTQSV
jgi:3-oxocholest-4-en-26-oate---CoA ligase